MLYARAAGIEILAADSLLSGRRSAPVSGMFHPTIALRRMVATSGLDVRYMDSGAVTLLPHQMPGRQTADLSDPYASFSAALQFAFVQMMCAYDGDSVGTFRVAAQLWIGPTGAVEQSLLLDSTGDRDRDVAVTKRLEALRIGHARPDNLPQPATVIFAPPLSRDSRGCLARRAGQVP